MSMEREVLCESLEAFSTLYPDGSKFRDALISASELLMYDKIEIDRRDRQLERLIGEMQKRGVAHE